MALTLAQIRAKVKSRYERSGVANDARNSVIDGFINDSLREIFNTIGDNAYFLRKTVAVTLSGYPSTTTMPAAVKRLYRLETSSAPGQPIHWTFVKHDTDGYLVILTHYSGDVTAHYLTIPDDLSADGDTTLLPTEHGELCVVLACKRLAESVGNEVLTGLLMSDIEVLLRALKRDCLRYGGMRHESLQTIWNRGLVGPWAGTCY